MKGKKLFVVIILGVFIALFAAADVFVYTQGRQSVKHVQAGEEKSVKDSVGEAFVIMDGMDAFTVTNNSKKITADVSILGNDNNDEKTTEEEHGDYIFGDSNSRYLKASDLKGMSKKQLRIARNELYARHGYIFEDEELAEYFNGKDWYVASIEGKDFNDNNIFNEYEIANRNLILKYEGKKKK